MTARRFAIAASQLVLLVLTAGTALGDINPQLLSAVSRRSHGGVNFDVPLALTGASGIEPRRTSGTMQLILFFDQPVTAGTAAVAPNTATVGSTSFANNTMTVNLTGVGNALEYTVTVSNVQSAAGGSLVSAVVPFRTLEGDVNGNGSVSSSDSIVTKLQIGANVTGFNYRSDINCNASISASDVNLIKAKVGTSLPGAPAPSMQNTPPTISAISNQTSNTGVATVQFVVNDTESDPASLAVSASSDNATLLPAGAAYAFSANGGTRTLVMTSATNITGAANVTVSVGDGLATASTSFTLTVTATPKLFLSRMSAPNSVITSLGNGVAFLQMDGDRTGANITVNNINLSGNATAMHIHGPAAPGSSGNLLFTLGAAQPDGSYRWNFSSSAVGGITVSDIANWVDTGQTYIDVHTSDPNNPETLGQFVFHDGTNPFTPPPAAPAAPTAPVNPNDAARFLTQATFGPAQTDIDALMTTTYNAWLTDQFSKPATSVYQKVYNRCTTSSLAADALASDRVMESVWGNMITAPDQLRQRVAWAYSQIFVVSAQEDSVDAQPAGMATYHDMLANDAFVNFRQLLSDVTLHPIMGQYLNMRGNVKASSSNGFTAPNENYAREILQLFSIGLYKLQPDGTFKYDVKGNLIPTYDQSVVQGFAQVFTGWNTDPTGVDIPTLTSTGTVIVTSTYNKPMIVTAGNHSQTDKLLLDGVTIGSTTSQTSATANAELGTALDNIFNNPNVGPFICRELIQRLVTTTPSPAYIYRVASIFNNNGSGVRGDMQAVIKAILTDYEARSNNVIGLQGYGHLREPVLRLTNVIRAFHPASASGYYKLARTDSTLFQSPYRSQTVFNFYVPDFSQPGIISQAGLDSPEFQIFNENSAIQTANIIYTGVTSSFPGSDVTINLTSESNITTVSALLDELNLLLMNGQMPQAMKDRITTFINTLPNSTTTDKLNRAKAAVHLVASSAAYATEK